MGQYSDLESTYYSSDYNCATRKFDPKPRHIGLECNSGSECAFGEGDRIERPTILEEAGHIALGQREEDYGDKLESFNRIAVMWGGYLGVKIDAYDVANMMIALKISRARGKGFQRDSYVDIAGYAYCAEIIKGKKDAKKNKGA